MNTNFRLLFNVKVGMLYYVVILIFLIKIIRIEIELDAFVIPNIDTDTKINLWEVYKYRTNPSTTQSSKRSIPSSKSKLKLTLSNLLVSVQSFKSFSLKSKLHDGDNNDTSEFNSMSGISLSKCEELLQVGCEAAYKAGEIILKYRDGAVDVKETKYTDKDLVTEVDGQCQQVIEDYILSKFPMNHSFLGEESVLPGAEESIKALNEKLMESESKSNTSDGKDHKGDDDDSAKFLWIIDPIDGTTNFVHGMPLSAVSIACTYKGQILVGIVYDPYAGGNFNSNGENYDYSISSSEEEGEKGKKKKIVGEMFTAIKGTGITKLNGRQILVGKEQTLGEALVAGGCPPKASSQKPAWRGLSKLAPQVRSIRLLGSAAIMLAWIANGRLTAYVEPDLNSWDTAAGYLLIREAGGIVLDGETGEGYSLRTRSIVAANNEEMAKSLRKELLEVNAVSLDLDA